MSAKKIVYMNEFNVRMGTATYLPLVSGHFARLRRDQ